MDLGEAFAEPGDEFRRVRGNVVQERDRSAKPPNDVRQLSRGLLKGLFQPLGTIGLGAAPVLALKGANGVVLDKMKPASDERIANLQLVVEKLERKLAIERLHP